MRLVDAAGHLPTLKPLLAAVRWLRAIPYIGSGRVCPICERSSRKFRRYGEPRRHDAQCAHCGSLERHRLAWLFIRNRTDLFDGSTKSVLHVAPESCLEGRFRKRLGTSYLTADLLDDRAMVKMDVTNINFPDRSFDSIYCSHVLEHVSDDRKAMAEFHRILKEGGWAILLVPITSHKTIEDPSITDPAERLRLFGQKDHVRRYGPDYVERLRDAGFEVEIVMVGELASADQATQMGLTPAAGEIYYCTKPA
ncbi:MAG: methyltransferase domain-containing protein [Gammaproteobacteria bacterium]|nr:methyltransferase domain-containing protein [Gammaproteobacteria bacterium]